MSEETSDIFDKIRIYFQSISDILADERRCSEVFPNPTDMGTIRESALKKFLISHLPKRCDIVSGGFIFDSEGNKSKQLDLIITNDLTLQFKQFEENAGKSFAAIEGCYAIISVKSTLTKSKLYECLEEFSSIPETPKMKIMPTLQVDKSLTERIPYRCIFAFSGLSKNKIVDHMNEYWGKNPTEEHKKPDLIIVNNNCVIEKTDSKEMTLRNGKKIKPHTYLLSERTHLGGYGLWRMIELIQETSNIGSQMIFDFHKYHNKLLDSF